MEARCCGSMRQPEVGGYAPGMLFHGLYWCKVAPLEIAEVGIEGMEGGSRFHVATNFAEGSCGGLVTISYTTRRVDMLQSAGTSVPSMRVHIRVVAATSLHALKSPTSAVMPASS